jgi:ribonuclease HI
VELGQFDIEFHPRTTIKDEAMADIWVEMCNVSKVEELPKRMTWIAHVYRSSTNQRSGVGVTLSSPEGGKLEYAIKLEFLTTNNEAEYEVVLAGLSIAREMGVTNLEIRSSQVVVGQISGDFAAQGDKMARYLEKVCQLQSHFDRVVLTKIPKEENVWADALSRVGSRTEQKIQASRRRILVKIAPFIAPESDTM